MIGEDAILESRTPMVDIDHNSNGGTRLGCRF